MQGDVNLVSNCLTVSRSVPDDSVAGPIPVLLTINNISLNCIDNFLIISAYDTVCILVSQNVRVPPGKVTTSNLQ